MTKVIMIKVNTITVYIFRELYCENKQKHVTDTIDLTVQNLTKVKKKVYQRGNK